MASLLTDEEVFGTAKPLSDEEVFGASAAAPRADPKIGQPEELTAWEKFASMFPDSWAATKGGKVGGFLRGAADPGVAIAQIAANATGNGKAVNDWVAGKEKEYQDARAIEGRDGIDFMRAAGNITATAPLGAVGSGVVKGAAVGAGAAALEPVNDTSRAGFWTEKAKDSALGAVGGAVMAPIFGALARVVSPNSSIDPAVKMLKDEGVEMSIGQTLGGVANQIEQKLTSVPFLGDAIANARRRGMESFQVAGLNRAVAPVGGKVTQGGHEGVKEAGDMLSAAYDAAANQVGHINFATPKMVSGLEQLETMVSQGLSPDMAAKFTGIADRVIARRISPNGSIVGQDLKKVDSELGQIAANWRGSQNPSDREFGDAVRQLQQLVRDGMADASPAYKAAKDAADEGWRSLVPMRKAAGSTGATNNEGISTPAQLMAAIKSGDKSVGKRATAEGEAWMQDLARAGQRLGTKVPDSGTVGRLANITALASAAAHPAIPAALAGSAALYSRPVQNALRTAVLKRPKGARKVANSLRELSTPAALAMGPLMQRD